MYAQPSAKRQIARPRSRSRLLVAFMAALMAASAAVVAPTPSVAPVEAATNYVASGFEFREPVAVPCLNPGNINGFLSTYYVKNECLRLRFIVSNTPTSAAKSVNVELIGPSGGAPFATVAATQGSNDNWMMLQTVGTSWPSGRITARIKVVGESASAGETTFFVNQLGALVAPDVPGDGSYTPGEAIPLSGNIAELNDVAENTERTGVPAKFKLRLVAPNGTVLHTSPEQTASSALGSEGNFTYTIPAGTTSGVTADADTEFVASLAIEVFDASYTDAALGEFVGNPAGVGEALVNVPPSTLLIENLFSSPSGWVKPGELFPFRVFVRNYTNSAKNNVTVTIPAPPSTSFVSASPLGGAGSASTGGGNTVTWNIGTLAAATGTSPTTATLVVVAKAATLAQDPEIVWKDLSSTATVTYTGGPGGLTASTHGPKVIPPVAEYETARYGDKPFVMVPVDYRDRKHEPEHTGEALSNKVNSTAVEGSTMNLYQEMSYGQLFPFGTVPSAGVTSRGFDYAHEFEFSSRDPLKDCRGTTLGDLPQPAEEATYGTPAYPERISDGWYQLPGDTEYYGGDFPAFTLGVGSQIDGACGPTGQAVYDAAVIADPEIDYNEYDLDKDGVVDFFMLVFAGAGGNGSSQTSVPPYDNIWPHSSSLEYSYENADGLKGYVSDDQLKSLEGVPQCFVDTTFTDFADCNGGNSSRPVPVRVGPYNVNPEAAIDQASVIAHEYGHHLGLPDYYSTSYTTYNDWNLMATDFSQHMTIFSKQDLGWVVPEFLQPGQTRTVTNWKEIKNDTGQIRWQRPDGTFYTLSAANGDQNIHNGQAYGVKLPRRKLIESSQVQAEASLPNVFYSGRGNDFGCTPIGGHNLDIALPELATLPAGTPVTLTFKSKWDIEWDFDFGYVMTTTNGQDYVSQPSQNLYTTPSSINPNNSACQETYGNGITGTSGSYRDNTFAVDRNPASPIYKDSPFLEDEYDLTHLAGQAGAVVRFSYYTDPGLDRPGWFIDDLVVKAGSQTIYSNNFTNDDDVHVFPGGCGENGLQSAKRCTDGWSLVDATSPSTLDHAYYLELRDRSGYDANGQGQADRGAITWSPGALIEFTDESRGYGNNGGSPPRQHYIDSKPMSGLDCGEALVDDPTTTRDDTAKFCTDAAFTAAAGDTHFDDNPNGGAEPGDWIDNFSDPASDDGLWHFAYNCLSFDVTSMSGTDVNEALPSNLTANATITALAGCAPFSYTGTYANTAPVADGTAKPNPAKTGQTITFDGSGSTDDLTPASQLIYDWDLDNNGTYEKHGQVVTGSYSTTGTKTVKLRVTDKSVPAKSSIDTFTVTVNAAVVKPDLTIAASSYTPTTIHKGNNVTFKATVKNIGGTTAPATKTQWFRYKANGMSGAVLGLVNTPSLAPGASAQVQLTINTSRWRLGRYQIRVYADIKDVVSEQPPNNNNGFYFYITIMR